MAFCPAEQMANIRKLLSNVQLSRQVLKLRKQKAMHLKGLHLGSLAIKENLELHPYFG